jgi:ribosome-associated heat shock protein Hsp15
MRLDKWLWAARFYKTRTLSVQAIEAGHISVNGERAKAAKAVRVGDAIEIRKPPFAHVITVKGLSERRGPAAEAQALYEESDESRARRMELAAQMRVPGPGPRFQGRPTKKDRRDYERWFRGTGEDEDTERSGEREPPDGS